MSNVNKNRKTILLGALIVVVIIGVCFACVTIYAKNEINKPKFQMPESPDTPLTQTLTDKDKAFAYAMEKYASTIGADDTEGSWKTDVRRLDEDWTTPFSKADEAIFSTIRRNAGDRLKEMYPKADNARLCEAEAVPALDKQASDVLEYTVTIGRENDKKEIVDADRCFLTLTFDPQSEDAQAIIGSETYRQIAAELAPVLLLSDTQVTVESVTMLFEIECINEELLSVEIRRDLHVSTVVRASADAAALVTEQEGRIEMPYGTTQKISFKHYGAHFTAHAIAVKPGDIKVLPAKVSTGADTDKNDFTLTFTASDPRVLTFDADGVMTVGKTEVDEAVTVTMTLEYAGHTYTDQLTVYVTNLEVDDNVGA